jgi:hypothetical protein
MRRRVIVGSFGNLERYFQPGRAVVREQPIED